MSQLRAFSGDTKPASKDDISLAKLVRCDRDEFGKVAQLWGGPLFRWLSRLTRNPHAAEDLTQDTLVRAWKALGRLRPDTNLRAWLFRIAHNAYANWVRSRVGRNGALPEMPDSQPGPILTAEGKEAQERIQVALDRLPPDWKVALLLRVQEDMAFKEMAVVCEVTEETARWRVFKARQKLLELLEESIKP